MNQEIRPNMSEPVDTMIVKVQGLVRLRPGIKFREVTAAMSVVGEEARGKLDKQLQRLRKDGSIFYRNGWYPRTEAE